MISGPDGRVDLFALKCRTYILFRWSSEWFYCWNLITGSLPEAPLRDFSAVFVTVYPEGCQQSFADIAQTDDLLMTWL